MTAPGFNFDPTAVQVALGQFNKGRYQFEIVSAKAYQRTKKDASGAPAVGDGSIVVGIYYGLKCVGGDMDGQRQIYNAMLHNDGSLGFSKQFLMAALGFNPRDVNSEKDFDKKFAGLAWGIDVNTGGAGDMWGSAKGHMISLECDLGIDTNGNQQQKFSNPQPVTS